MEQFIAIAVIMAAGLAYDYIKNRAADRRRKQQGARPAQPRAAARPHQPSRKEAAPVAVAARPAAKPAKAAANAAPRPRHTEYTPLVIEEGGRVTADTADTSAPSPQAAPDSAARRAHFERWRRAVIDAEVISSRNF